MNLFELEPEDFSKIPQDEAVSFIRRLLWAEASRIGIGRHLIDVPSNINAGDGGLDSLVTDNDAVIDDCIPQGLSGFQIKASDLAPKECQNELCVEKDPNRLKPGIERILSTNGTYVLILFSSLPDPMRKRREEAISQKFSEFGFNDAKFRIYSLEQIIGFANRFPALVAIQKNQNIECIPYDSWARNRDVSQPAIFINDKIRTTIIDDLRKKLRDSIDRTSIIRITGLPGVGKTRLIFETLADSDLKNRVIFVNAVEFKNSQLKKLLQIDKNLSVIIVIDECSPKEHGEFLNIFSNHGRRLALITLSFEISKFPPPTLLYNIEPLSKEEIIQLIINEIGVQSSTVIERIAYFCGGYPRFAYLLAENYRSSVETPVQNIFEISDQVLIDRLIAGRYDPASDDAKKTKRVLTGLALFEKIGYKGEDIPEWKWIAEFVGVSQNEFEEIVHYQKERGLIRGDYYLYLTPHILVAHLIKEWWDLHGTNFDFIQFVDKIPIDLQQNLLKRFTARIPFVVSTDPGKKLVKNLLSPTCGGLYSDGTYLKDQFGAELFLKLAEADPASALGCLRRTIGLWDNDQLLKFSNGRREIIWALERIVIWKPHFAEASQLLLALGVAENESYGNNASGVFSGLFSPAWSGCSPTEASLQERYPVLIHSFESGSVTQKMLTLKGFEQALSTGPFSRIVGAEYQGANQTPKLWSPKDVSEVLDWYRIIWTYLQENLEGFDAQIQEKAVDILLNSSRGLVNTEYSLAKMVIDTYKILSKKPWIEKSALLDTIISIIHYDQQKLPEEFIEALIQLRDEITGTGYSNLIQRFIAMDFLEDNFHDGKEYSKDWVNLKIQDLAQQAIVTPELLEKEFRWILTSKAKKGFEFGFELGRLDSQFSFLSTILEKQKALKNESNGAFIGGYFRSLFDHDKKIWREQVLNLRKDELLKRFVPEIISISDIDDWSAKLILDFVKKEEAPLQSLLMFRYGNQAKRLSASVFRELTSFLLSNSSKSGAAIALEITHSLIFNKADDGHLDKNQTIKILFNDHFWSNPNNLPINQMTGFHWNGIAIALIEQYPEMKTRIVRQLIKSLGNLKSLNFEFEISIFEFLSKIAVDNPTLVWNIVSLELGPPFNKKSYHLANWLRGEKSRGNRHKSALVLFDPSDIWTWVDGNIEERSVFIANFVSPELFHSDTQICLAREILLRYGDQQNVRNALSSNFSKVFSGTFNKFTDPYIEQRNTFLQFRSLEKNPTVICWIEEYLDKLDREIERMKIWEEKI